MDIIKFGGHIDPIILAEEGIEKELSIFDGCIASASRRLNFLLKKFWNLPDDLLLTLLNKYGPVAVLGSAAATALGIPYEGDPVEGIFPAHEARAAALNEMLAKRGLPTIAEIGAKKSITLNSQGLFEIVPPVVTPPEG